MENTRHTTNIIDAKLVKTMAHIDILRLLIIGNSFFLLSENLILKENTSLPLLSYRVKEKGDEEEMKANFKQTILR